MMALQQDLEGQLRPELEKILECYLHSPSLRQTAIIPCFTHRLNILDAWALPSSASRLLDIGCGQGESSLILASLPGQVHVTGVDSAPLGYGGPYTLGQAQAYILNSSLGQRITFEQADPVTYLRPGDAPAFDAAFFCHSLWYWSSVDRIHAVFAALANSRVPKIYIAEWAGEASRPNQEPHVLAARAQKELYALRPAPDESRFHEQNVRSALSPDDLFDLAAEAGGWKIARRGIVTPPDDLMEGVWETDYVRSDDYYKKGVLEIEGLTEEKKEELLGYSQLVTEAVRRCGGRTKVRSMDVTWAVLERDVSKL